MRLMAWASRELTSGRRILPAARCAAVRRYSALKRPSEREQREREREEQVRVGGDKDGSQALVNKDYADVMGG